MLAGYILSRYQTPPIKIKPAANFTLWVMALGVMFLLLFGVWDGSLSLQWTALYVSVGHTGTDN